MQNVLLWHKLAPHVPSGLTHLDLTSCATTDFSPGVLPPTLHSLHLVYNQCASFLPVVQVLESFPALSLKTLVSENLDCFDDEDGEDFEAADDDVPALSSVRTLVLLNTDVLATTSLARIFPNTLTITFPGR